MLQRRCDFADALERKRVAPIEQGPRFSRLCEHALGFFERLRKPERETLAERAPTTIRNRLL